MRFPKMIPKSASRLRVADLFGGVNLRDGLSEVLDNQLTAAKNAWYQDGLLKTRPGVRALGEILVGRITKQKNVVQKIWPKVKYKADGREYVLTVIKKDEDIDYSGEYKTTLRFFWQNKETTLDITTLAFDEQVNYFVTQDNSAIYLYASNCEIYKYEFLNENKFVKLAENSIYVPTIAINCRSGGYALGGESPETLLTGATLVNGFNIIGNRAKFYYSTVNLDLLDETDENSTHNMNYDIPYLGITRKKIPQLLEVNITQPNGTVITHTATQTDGALETTAEFYEEGYQLDDLTMKIYCNGDNAEICFYKKGNDKVMATVKSSDYLLNNLEVIIPYTVEEKERAKVFAATQCAWFGGGTEGIAGGTRLFLGGNTSEGNENLVVWSDLNNPLYFPENNYFRVGENSSAVIGFGKQSDMLVIFKENGSGIYYTKYQQNSDITGEDLTNQSVVDYVASSVYFPLVQINPNIGCSCPETIQLCRNRLVWLGNNGNVYTLVSESQYNERSVFCVSEMVARDLKRNIKENATACDWNGYYCLMCGNKMYLMDYNCYGYTHIASYSKTEDANIRIPWYIWELPVEFENAYMCESDDAIFFARYNDGESYAECVALSYVLSLDNESVDWVFAMYDDKDMEALTYLAKFPIQTTLRTKLFTFGEPSKRKSVDKINLLLGNNGGEPITVKVITDQSEEEHDIYLTGTQTEAYTPGYIDSKAIFPTARNFLRIGLELSSEGVIAVDGMELKFRLLGGSR